MSAPASPEEPKWSQRRDPSELALLGGFGRTVKGLGLVLILLIIGLLFGRKVWNASSRQNARELVEDARHAVEHKEWENAARLIRAAREILPNDPELLRVMVEYLGKTGLDPSLELQTLRALEALRQQQPGDAILAGRAHVRRGDLTAARAVWQKLSKPQQTTADALEFKAQILTQEGGEHEADKLQKLATQRSADDPQSALKLAVLDLESGYPAMVVSGLARLWKITDRNDDVGLRAIRYLLTRNELTQAEAKRLQELMDNHPEATLSDDLGALSAVMHLAPAQRSQLLDEVMARHKNAGLEVTMMLARWLSQEREHERLMNLLPPEIMIKSNDLFPIFLQALAESGRWQEMHELLKKTQGLPMTLEGLTVWRALASSRLHPDLKRAADELKLAIRQAATTKNFGPLRAAAQVAEDLELWDIAMEGYLHLAQPESRHELDMLEKCWQIAARLGDSDHLLGAARRQSSLRPTSAHFANRLDYLRLLRGEEIETAVSHQRESPGYDYEENSMAALLAALKAYRLGDAELAKASLKQVQDAATLPVGQRAVYAGLLASVGEPAQAFQLAEKISVRLLIAEEQAFLRKAL
ncbi:MAG: hypothetical protein JWR15_4289 [Prosthecobacter sp.]|nr:hypothetical protein [Prosthecobacter sp.]